MESYSSVVWTETESGRQFAKLYRSFVQQHHRRVPVKCLAQIAILLSFSLSLSHCPSIHPSIDPPDCLSILTSANPSIGVDFNCLVAPVQQQKQRKASVDGVGLRNTEKTMWNNWIVIGRFFLRPPWLCAAAAAAETKAKEYSDQREELHCRISVKRSNVSVRRFTKENGIRDCHEAEIFHNRRKSGFVVRDEISVSKGRAVFVSAFE